MVHIIPLEATSKCETCVMTSIELVDICSQQFYMNWVSHDSDRVVLGGGVTFTSANVKLARRQRSGPRGSENNVTLPHLRNHRMVRGTVLSTM